MRHRPAILAVLVALGASLGAPAAPARDGLVVFLFDDGRAEHAAVAAPALEARGWRGCVGVVSGRIGEPGYVGADDVRALHAAGHEIIDHTLHHDVALWSDPAGAARWGRRIRASLEIFAGLGVRPRLWDQPGGPGQGFPDALRDTLARWYDAAAGRVGLDVWQVRNFHRNLSASVWDLGRGGVYLWGYNAPGRGAAAEVAVIRRRIADGVAAGLVVVPAFGRIARDDSSRWGFEEVVRFVERHALDVRTWSQALSWATARPSGYGEQIPNPGLRLDRDGDGRPDAWWGVLAVHGATADLGRGAHTTVFGPDPGRTRLGLRARTHSGRDRLVVTLTALERDATGDLVAHSWQRAAELGPGWTTLADTFVVPPGTERVEVAFGGVEAQFEVTDVSWRRIGAGGAPPSGTIRLTSAPNPFRGWTRIVVENRRAARATLAIYDAAGRRVRTLSDTPFGEGTHEFIWNGRDRRGTPVASGVYFCRVEAGRTRTVRRLVLVR